MTIEYVDAHCHVQFPEYDHDRDAVIERMHEQGVGGIVVGCDLESSQKAVALAEKHEHLFASVGQHPNHAEEFNEVKIRTAVSSPRVVAIGECGLDYYRSATTKEAQKTLFKKHIALAVEFDKPLIIHCRPSSANDAYHDLIEILTEAKQKNPNVRGDIHFFVGGVPEATQLIELGFTISFTAVITFARDYDEVIRAVPLESILTETDSPYVAPVSHRGERNDPLAVVDVVSKIAEIRGENPELVRDILLANSKKLFSI